VAEERQTMTQRGSVLPLAISRATRWLGVTN
jgi:hypothetical protein